MSIGPAAAGVLPLRSPEVAEDSATLRTALGLWRGPALAEVPRNSSAQAEAARLEEDRLGVAAMAGRRWEQAETHFRTALEQARTIPNRPEQAHTRRWYGQMLIERHGPGDRENARQLIGLAIADNERMGMARHRGLAAGLLMTE